jgi:prophage DNA circulation protein
MQILEKIKEQKVTISIGAIITIITTSWFAYSQYYNFKESIVNKDNFEETIDEITEDHENDIQSLSEDLEEDIRSLREIIEDFEKEIEEMLLIAKLTDILSWKEDNADILEAEADIMPQ